MPTTELRKRPSQTRSKFLVDTILEGAARVLTDPSKGNLSTNRVAKVAGVSIGSLYQYFPGKEAIVTALGNKSVEWTFGPILSAIDELFERDPQAPIETFADAIMDVALRIKLSNLGLETSLFKVLMRLGILDSVTRRDPEFVEAFAKRIVRVLSVRRPGIPFEQAYLKAHVLYHSLRSTVIITSLQAPEMLRQGAFRAELTRMICRTLSDDAQQV